MSKLILTRHGQSIWNAENRFTGWVDVDLSKKGVIEAEKSGELIRKSNINIYEFPCNVKYGLNNKKSQSFFSSLNIISDLVQRK